MSEGNFKLYADKFIEKKIKKKALQTCLKPTSWIFTSNKYYVKILCHFCYGKSISKLWNNCFSGPYMASNGNLLLLSLSKPFEKTCSD